MRDEEGNDVFQYNKGNLKVYYFIEQAMKVGNPIDNLVMFNELLEKNLVNN